MLLKAFWIVVVLRDSCYSDHNIQETFRFKESVVIFLQSNKNQKVKTHQHSATIYKKNLTRWSHVLSKDEW